MNGDIHLPVTTAEKAAYREHWAFNSSHFKQQGCYKWMAEQLLPLQPTRVLDIGCGTGEGILALLTAFSPTIISLEENGNCIDQSYKVVSSAGYSAEAIFRLGYQEFSDGTHDMVFSQEPIVTSSQVSLVHADLLVDDPAMLNLLAECPPFDAVTIWLIGTLKTRATCRNLSNLKIADSQEYRLRVQNRVYEFAHRVLRPGGWLQVVDRGEPPASEALRDDVLESHREQAKPTDLEVFDLHYREYTEPAKKGIRMEASLGTSGRTADLSKLAMISVLSRKR